jgi:hypothetical protein
MKDFSASFTTLFYWHYGDVNNCQKQHGQSKSKLGEAFLITAWKPKGKYQRRLHLLSLTCFSVNVGSTRSGTFFSVNEPNGEVTPTKASRFFSPSSERFTHRA